jgi:hypothetical protein
VVVNTSDWITSSTVLDALDYGMLRLGGHQLTMVINKADLKALETNLRGHRIPRHVTIPRTTGCARCSRAPPTSASASGAGPVRLSGD